MKSDHTQNIDTNPTSHTASAEYSQGNVKLFTINLATFSGNYKDWISFFDTLSALIDTNETSEVQKLFTLSERFLNW